MTRHTHDKQDRMNKVVDVAVQRLKEKLYNWHLYNTTHKDRRQDNVIESVFQRKVRDGKTSLMSHKIV